LAHKYANYKYEISIYHLPRSLTVNVTVTMLIHTEKRNDLHNSRVIINSFPPPSISYYPFILFFATVTRALIATFRIAFTVYLSILLQQFSDGTCCHCIRSSFLLYIYIYRVIQNDCRGFNNLSYTIHLRQEYMCFFI